MKFIAPALVTLSLVGLGFAQEDRFERALREARELSAKQTYDAEHWLHTPAGQKWLEAYKSRGPQESTYSGEVGRARSANPWGEAVDPCAGEVGGKFSAFAPVPGRVQMVGSARERYAFSECMACMAGLGVPVGSPR
jgi:hypothetical protein